MEKHHDIPYFCITGSKRDSSAIEPELAITHLCPQSYPLMCVDCADFIDGSPDLPEQFFRYKGIQRFVDYLS
jgi:hypothetical protein